MGLLQCFDLVTKQLQGYQTSFLFMTAQSASSIPQTDCNELHYSASLTGNSSTQTHKKIKLQNICICFTVWWCVFFFHFVFQGNIFIYSYLFCDWVLKCSSGMQSCRTNSSACLWRLQYSNCFFDFLIPSVDSYIIMALSVSHFKQMKIECCSLPGSYILS